MTGLQPLKPFKVPLTANPIFFNESANLFELCRQFLLVTGLCGSFGHSQQSPCLLLYCFHTVSDQLKVPLKSQHTIYSHRVLNVRNLVGAPYFLKLGAIVRSGATGYQLVTMFKLPTVE